MEEKRPRILIVDDDVDFSSLLSDVFSHASYRVETLSDPTRVLPRVESGNLDLVITDLRMPGIDGAELSHKIRAVRPELPVIVVSGFLDSKAREQMEGSGVAALYEKPLSVFSLLKDAAKLIQEHGKHDPGEDGEEDAADAAETEMDPHLQALPCESESSREFAEALHELRDRRNSFCVIAPRGVPSRAIAQEFCAWIASDTAAGRVLEPKECNEEVLGTIVEEAVESGLETLVLCVTEVEELEPSRQKQLARATRKGTLKEKWEGNLRFLFFIGADVESLYHEGSLSDELYLSMGSAELSVPPLRNCPEDIKAMARACHRDDGSPLDWEENALKALADREWPGNHAELRKVLLRLQQDNRGEPVTATEVIAVAAEQDAPVSETGQTERRPLIETLEDCRKSYLQAAFSLLDKDADAVARMAQVSPTLVRRVVGLDLPQASNGSGRVRSRERERR